MLLPRLKARLSHWLALILLLVAMPALAQQAETTASDTASDTMAYSTLADLLENDATRQRLIGQLRTLASDDAGASIEAPGELAAQEAAGEPTPADTSLARRLAETTSGVASDLGQQFTALTHALSTLFTSADPDAGPQISMAEITDAALNLALVIVATFATFVILRSLARPLFSRVSHWSQHSGGRSPLLR
ncbi:mechanosensitive ion channel protein MscS, partial [Halomonas sp. BBD48]|nr:mechanosensitive ion channel protein MscS [Halomonas sp. BBD48]